MRKPMKIGLILVVILLLFSIPFLCGIVAEKQFKNYIQSLQAVPNLKVQLNSYHRGLLRSQANINVQIDLTTYKQLVKKNAAVSKMPLGIDMVINVDHGPIILARELAGSRGVRFGLAYLFFKGNLDKNTMQVLQASFQGSIPELKGTAHLKFTDDVVLKLQVPAFVLKEQNNKVASFDSLDGEWLFNLKSNHFSGNYHWKNLEFAVNDLLININNLDVTYDGQRGVVAATPLMSTLNETANLPQILVSQSGDKILEVTGIKFVSQINMDNGNFDITHNAELDKASFSTGITYGPGRYNLNLKHLSPDVLAKLLNQAIAYNNAANEQQKNVLALATLPTVVEFFTKGAELQLMLDIVTPDGPLATKLDFVLQSNSNAAPPVEQKMTSIDMTNIIKKVNLHFDLKMPVILAERIFNYLNSQDYRRKLAAQQSILQANRGQAVIDPQNVVNAPLENVAAVNKSEQEITSTVQQMTKQQLNNLVNRGVLIENNGSYHISVVVEKGQMLVNGKTPEQVQGTTESGVTPPVQSDEQSKNINNLPGQATQLMSNTLAPSAGADVQQNVVSEQDASVQQVAPLAANKLNAANDAAVAMPVTSSLKQQKSQKVAN